MVPVFVWHCVGPKLETFLLLAANTFVPLSLILLGFDLQTMSVSYVWLYTNAKQIPLGQIRSTLLDYNHATAAGYLSSSL